MKPDTDGAVFLPAHSLGSLGLTEPAPGMAERLGLSPGKDDGSSLLLGRFGGWSVGDVVDDGEVSGYERAIYILRIFST